MAEMKNCSKVLYFEGRKKKDLFLTVADVEEGPTIRFNVEGLNTMGELKFSGNCLKVKIRFYRFTNANKIRWKSLLIEYTAKISLDIKTLVGI